MLATRIKTALILLFTLLAIGGSAAYFTNGEIIIVALAWTVAGLSAFEFARLFARDDATSRYNFVTGSILFCLTFGPILTVLPVAISWVQDKSAVIDAERFAFWSVWFLLAGLYQVAIARNDLEKSRTVASFLWPGMALISICGSAILLFAAIPRSYLMMWWLIGVVVATDSAAYFVGKTLSGPKLAPAISPNKTFSGALAGLLGGGAASLLLCYLIGNSANTWSTSLVFGIAVSFAAQTGDLMKSYLKRIRGVKDTGSILPGHGGILDRCDGLLAGAVVALTGTLWN